MSGTLKRGSFCVSFSARGVVVAASAGSACHFTAWPSAGVGGGPGLHHRQPSRHAQGLLVLVAVVVVVVLVVGLNTIYSFIVIISSTNKYRKHKSSMLI